MRNVMGLAKSDVYELLYEGFLLYTIVLGSIVIIGLMIYILVNSGKIAYCPTCKQAVIQTKAKYNWWIAGFGLLTAGVMTIVYTVWYFMSTSNCPKCRSELVYISREQLDAIMNRKSMEQIDTAIPRKKETKND